ncbi:MAG: ABC transporter substrate-binding protein [Candidatus Schekmanbacteria bacterium]|nr:ABC transporter substrate-binding protein [Candidatus Schekmanbacteria bacterium]
MQMTCTSESTKGPYRHLWRHGSQRRATTFCAWALLALATVALPSCTRTGNGDGAGAASDLYIGLAGPMTGSAAEYGAMMKSGAELAQDELNAGNAFGGKKLQLVTGDDQSKNDQAKLVAKKLAEDQRVSVVVGHFNSTCSLAGKDTYKRAGVVQFSPGSTNVNVCKGSEWTFRNLYHDEFQGQFLARYAKNVLHAQRIAVFYDNDDYGIGLKDALVTEAKALGIEVLREESYVREKTLDYSAALDTVAGLAPDLIVVSGLYNEAGAIMKQARAKGITAPFIGGDGLLSSGLVDIGGPAVEGAVVSCPFIFDDAVGTPRSKAFREAFRKRFNKEPDTWAALSYDAVMMSAAAIAKVGTDRKAIRDYFASIDTEAEAFQGVTGPTYFDANGDCLKPAYMALVKDGHFVAAPVQMSTDGTPHAVGDGGGAPAPEAAAPPAEAVPATPRPAGAGGKARE